MNPDLLILCATPVEVSHFLSLCPQTAIHTNSCNYRILSGKIDSRSYDLVITGVGVFNAVAAFCNYLAHAMPFLVINTGIAGGFKSAGCCIGDVAVATQEHYIHTGVRTEGLKNQPLPFDLLSGHPRSREGIYPFDARQVEAVQARINQKENVHDLHLKQGPFITVSAITNSLETAEQIYSAYDAPLMEAMEGAACAHVAADRDIPFLEIRSVSNLAGERDPAKWDIPRAVHNLGRVLALI